MTARKIMVVPCIVNSWLYVLRRQEGVVRLAQLDADQQRLDPADQEEDEGGGAVEDADPLVVDGGDPAPQPGLLAVAGAACARC